jgi:putative phosphoesterase
MKPVCLQLEGTRALRLGIVADTHSAPHPHANEHLRALGVDAILHAGDIGDAAVLRDLEHIAPVVAVLGNIDAGSLDVPETREVDIVRGGETALRILLLHIGVAGARLRSDAFAAARASGASIVVCGHSHVPLIARDRGIVVFNPGSIGPRRFHLPIVFGTIEVRADGVTFRHYDAATGAVWEPREVATAPER